ncbi:MAG: hypothetical protein K9M08_04635 [Pirellula sp.]|nr:hypothetical protein [Pirellula sp.]
MTEMGGITPATKRLPLIAALLSLMGGPIGQVYAGRFRRASLWWIFELLLSFGAAVGLAQTGVSQGLFIAIVGICRLLIWEDHRCVFFLVTIDFLPPTAERLAQSLWRMWLVFRTTYSGLATTASAPIVAP